MFPDSEWAAAAAAAAAPGVEPWPSEEKLLKARRWALAMKGGFGVATTVEGKWKAAGIAPSEAGGRWRKSILER
jgi:hypothetical protein